MKKHITLKRLLTAVMVICMMASLALPAFAADLDTTAVPYSEDYTLGTAGQNGQQYDTATIDTGKLGSIELYKIDFTNAEKDGVWDSNSYISTGIYDQEVNNKLINNAVRDGDDDTTSVLGNGQTSNGYAIKGVEFTYLKVADIEVYSEVEEDANGNKVNKTMVLYKFAKESKATVDLLKALGLANISATGTTVVTGYYTADTANYYFESDTLVNALRNQLAANATDLKNDLEAYVAANGGTAMPETDANGYTSDDNMPLGLYLMVETMVPEEVTNTTNPFFVSLPMTTVDGTNTNSDDATDGGQSWLYDVTLYPKNETGIPSLEKTVRETMADTGKNSNTEPTTENAIEDGFKHYATASDGDTVEYQIISTLPSITSTATQLSMYTFEDTLAEGLTYTKTGTNVCDVKIEWFRDEDCTDKITTWNAGDGKFTVTAPSASETSSNVTMRIEMTADGLNEINTAETVWNADSQVRQGYSDCTMRITYTATVNSDASVNYGEMGNDNDVVLKWQRSNQDYYDTLIDDAHVYTYGIDLTKYFSDVDFSNLTAAQKTEVLNNLAEVEFVLWNDTDGYWVEAKLNESEGIYYVTNHLDNTTGKEGHNDVVSHPGTTVTNDVSFTNIIGHDAQDQAANANATVFTPVTGSDGSLGKIIIKGLEDDTYILTEIRTATGYTLLKDNITIVISAVETEALCDVYSGDILGVVQNDDRYDSDDNTVERTDLDTVLGLGGAVADGTNTVTGQNIPQDHLEHHLLNSSATVDGNAVTMLTDENGNSADALVAMSVVNTHGFDLPQTGDNTAMWMGIGGAAIAAIAAFVIVFFFVPKRKEDADAE